MRPRALTASKILSLFLGLILAGQPLLAALSESTFWEDRRLAALPAQTPIFPSLPAPAKAIPNLSKKYKNLRISSDLKDLLQSIPQSHARIQSIHDAKNPTFPPVVIIQDVHLNPEAQGNIASVLGALIEQKKVGLVGVEGAFEPLHFKPLWDLPDPALTKDVARAFLNQKFLAAPSFAGITHPNADVLFLGIDDKEHHAANVNAYLETRNLKPEIRNKLTKLKTQNDKTKSEVFSSDLKTLDGFYTAYHSGTIGIGSYIATLAGLTDNVDLTIEQFLEAYTMESTLDFNRVEHERKRVIEKLAQSLDPSEMAALLEKSLAYKTGRMSFGDYYSDLKSLCRKNKIDLRQTPHFDNYIRYVLLADGIDAAQLFDSVKQLEDRAWETLIRTDEQRRIVEETRYLALVDKLIDFSLTPTEWKEYGTSKKRISPSPRGEGIGVGNKAPPVQTPPLAPPPPKDVRQRTDPPWRRSAEADLTGRETEVWGELKKFEDFYQEAELRSELMVDNLLNYSRDAGRGTRNAVLVTGGFHSPEISDLLKEKNIPHIIVTPNLTKIDSESGSDYLTVFAREKTPLDRLFEGEKLFVNPTAVNGPVIHFKVRAADILYRNQSGVSDLGEIKGTPLSVAKTVPRGYREVSGLEVNGEYGGKIATPASIGGDMAKKWGLVFFILFVVGFSPLVETWIFHDGLFSLLMMGVPESTSLMDQVLSGIMSIPVTYLVAVLFARAHSPFERWTGLSDEQIEANYQFRRKLSLWFSVPYAFPFLADTAFWITVIGHAAYNVNALVKNWRAGDEVVPVASIQFPVVEFVAAMQGNESKTLANALHSGSDSIRNIMRQVSGSAVQTYRRAIDTLSTKQFSNQQTRPFIELILNAIDTEERLRYRSRSEMIQPIEIEIRDGYGAVRDHGEGIALEDLTKLLNPGEGGNLAQSATTGRFGAGFLSVFSYLQHPDDFVVIDSVSGKEANRYTIRRDDAGSLILEYNTLSHESRDQLGLGTRIQIYSSSIRRDKILKDSAHTLRYKNDATITVMDDRPWILNPQGQIESLARVEKIDSAHFERKPNLELRIDRTKKHGGKNGDAVILINGVYFTSIPFSDDADADPLILDFHKDIFDYARDRQQIKSNRRVLEAFEELIVNLRHQFQSDPSAFLQLANQLYGIVDYFQKDTAPSRNGSKPSNPLDVLKREVRKSLDQVSGRLLVLKDDRHTNAAVDYETAARSGLTVILLRPDLLPRGESLVSDELKDPDYQQIVYCPLHQEQDNPYAVLASDSILLVDPRLKPVLRDPSRRDETIAALQSIIDVSRAAGIQSNPPSLIQLEQADARETDPLGKTDETESDADTQIIKNVKARLVKLRTQAATIKAYIQMDRIIQAFDHMYYSNLDLSNFSEDELFSILSRFKLNDNGRFIPPRDLIDDKLLKTLPPYPRSTNDLSELLPQNQDGNPEKMRIFATLFYRTILTNEDHWHTGPIGNLSTANRNMLHMYIAGKKLGTYSHSLRNCFFDVLKHIGIYVPGIYEINIRISFDPFGNIAQEEHIAHYEQTFPDLPDYLKTTKWKNVYREFLFALYEKRKLHPKNISGLRTLVHDVDTMFRSLVGSLSENESRLLIKEVERLTPEWKKQERIKGDDIFGITGYYMSPWTLTFGLDDIRTSLNQQGLLGQRLSTHLYTLYGDVPSLGDIPASVIDFPSDSTSLQVSELILGINMNQVSEDRFRSVSDLNRLSQLAGEGRSAPRELIQRAQSSIRRAYEQTTDSFAFLREIVTNAYEAARSKGKLDEVPEFKVRSWLEEDDTVAISMSDEGVGMDLQDMIGKLFQPNASGWNSDWIHFGHGFYTLFRSADEIRIQSTRNGVTTTAFLSPVFQNGALVDLEMEVSSERSTRQSGTTIEWRQRSSNPGLLASEIYVTLKNYIGLFDPHKMRVTWNGQTVNKEMPALARIRNKQTNETVTLYGMSGQKAFNLNQFYMRELSGEFTYPFPRVFKEILLKYGLVMNLDSEEAEPLEGRSDFVGRNEKIQDWEDGLAHACVVAASKLYARGFAELDKWLPNDYIIGARSYKPRPGSQVEEDARRLALGKPLKNWDRYRTDVDAEKNSLLLLLSLPVLTYEGRKISTFDAIILGLDNEEALEKLPRWLAAKIREAKALKDLGTALSLSEFFDNNVQPEISPRPLDEKDPHAAILTVWTKLVDYVVNNTESAASTGSIEHEFYSSIFEGSIAHTHAGRSNIAWNIGAIYQELKNLHQLLTGKNQVDRASIQHLFYRLIETSTHEWTHVVRGESESEWTHTSEFYKHNLRLINRYLGRLISDGQTHLAALIESASPKNPVPTEFQLPEAFRFDGGLRGSVGSIWDPTIQFLKNKGTWGMTLYVLFTVVAAPAWETWVFHDWMAGALMTLVPTGHMLAGALLVTYVVAAIFSAAHTIVEWLTRSDVDKWKNFKDRFALSANLFSLPFALSILFPSLSPYAFWIAFALHAGWNALVLLGWIKMPLGSIVPTEINNLISEAKKQEKHYEKKLRRTIILARAIDSLSEDLKYEGSHVRSLSIEALINLIGSGLHLEIEKNQNLVSRLVDILLNKEFIELNFVLSAIGLQALKAAGALKDSDATRIPIDSFMANPSAPNTAYHKDRAEALKILVEANLLHADDLEKMKISFDALLINLASDSPFNRKNSAESLAILIEVGLINGNDIERTRIPIAFLLNGMMSKNIFERKNYAEVVGILIKAGLINRDEVLISTSELWDYIYQSEPLFREAASEYLLYLFNLDLLDIHVAPRIPMEALLEDLRSPNLSIPLLAAKTLKNLSDAGFINMSDDSFVPLKNFIRDFESGESPVILSNSRTLHVLVEAGLIKDPSIIEQLAQLYNRDLSSSFSAAVALTSLIEAGYRPPQNITERLVTFIFQNGYLSADLNHRSVGTQLLKTVVQACVEPGSELHESIIEWALELLNLKAPRIPEAASRFIKSLVEFGLATSDELVITRPLTLYERWFNLFPRTTQLFLLEIFYLLTQCIFLPHPWKANLNIVLRTIYPQNQLGKRKVKGTLIKLLEQKGEGSFSRKFISEMIRRFPLKELRLSNIEFRDGGNAQTDFSDYLKGLFNLGRFTGPVKPTNFPARTSIEKNQIPVMERPILQVGSNSIDISAVPDQQYGRTLVYRLADNSALLIKCLKENEDSSVLAYEHDMMNFINGKKAAWGLKGEYPIGRHRLGRIPRSSLPGLTSPLPIDQSDGLVTFMAYEVAIQDGEIPYTVYLNDPNLSIDEFTQALQINLHDRLVLARHGVMDLEIIELFHNQQNGRGRRYDWMVDVKHHQRTRRGAGRINNVPGATRYPNARLSGLADVAEFYFIDDLITERKFRELADQRIGRLRNMVDGDLERARPYVTAALLGDTLLSYCLIVATYAQRIGQMDYHQETENKNTSLQTLLQIVFDTAFETYTGQKRPKDINFRIQLMARQMAYFMTDQYTRDHNNGNPIPQDLFPGSEVSSIQPGRGWSPEMGWDIAEQSNPIPSRAPNDQTEASYDLGPVNGPTPLQELIRTLYIVTPLMISEEQMIRPTTSTADELFSNKKGWEYVLYTVIGAAVWETAVFQMEGIIPLSLLARSFWFLAAHLIVMWIVRAYRVGWKQKKWNEIIRLRHDALFALKLVLPTALFALPIYFGYHFSITMLLHAAWNAMVLAGWIKGPVASIGNQLTRDPYIIEPINWNDVQKTMREQWTDKRDRVLLFVQTQLDETPPHVHSEPRDLIRWGMGRLLTTISRTPDENQKQRVSAFLKQLILEDKERLEQSADPFQKRDENNKANQAADDYKRLLLDHLSEDMAFSAVSSANSDFAGKNITLGNGEISAVNPNQPAHQLKPARISLVRWVNNQNKEAHRLLNLGWAWNGKDLREFEGLTLEQKRRMFLDLNPDLSERLIESKKKHRTTQSNLYDRAVRFKRSIDDLLQNAPSDINEQELRARVKSLETVDGISQEYVEALLEHWDSLFIKEHKSIWEGFVNRLIAENNDLESPNDFLAALVTEEDTIHPRHRSVQTENKIPDSKESDQKSNRRLLRIVAAAVLSICFLFGGYYAFLKMNQAPPSTPDQIQAQRTTSENGTSPVTAESAQNESPVEPPSDSNEPRLDTLTEYHDSLPAPAQPSSDESFSVHPPLDQYEPSVHPRGANSRHKASTQSLYQWGGAVPQYTGLGRYPFFAGGIYQPNGTSGIWRMTGEDARPETSFRESGAREYTVIRGVRVRINQDDNFQGLSYLPVPLEGRESDWDVTLTPDETHFNLERTFVVNGRQEGAADNPGPGPLPESQQNHIHRPVVIQRYGLPEPGTLTDASPEELESVFSEIFHKHLRYSQTQGAANYWNGRSSIRTILEKAFPADGRFVPGCECDGLSHILYALLTDQGFHAELIGGYVDANEDGHLVRGEGHAIVRVWVTDPETGRGHYHYFDPVRWVENYDDWQNDIQAMKSEISLSYYWRSLVRSEYLGRFLFTMFPVLLALLGGALLYIFWSFRRYSKEFLENVPAAIENGSFLWRDKDQGVYRSYVLMTQQLEEDPLPKTGTETSLRDRFMDDVLEAIHSVSVATGRSHTLRARQTSPGAVAIVYSEVKGELVAVPRILIPEYAVSTTPSEKFKLYLKIVKHRFQSLHRDRFVRHLVLFLTLYPLMVIALTLGNPYFNINDHFLYFVGGVLLVIGILTAAALKIKKLEIEDLPLLFPIVIGAVALLAIVIVSYIGLGTLGYDAQTAGLLSRNFFRFVLLSIRWFLPLLISFQVAVFIHLWRDHAKKRRETLKSVNESTDTEAFKVRPILRSHARIIAPTLPFGSQKTAEGERDPDRFAVVSFAISKHDLGEILIPAPLGKIYPELPSDLFRVLGLRESPEPVASVNQEPKKRIIVEFHADDTELGDLHTESNDTAISIHALIGSNRFLSSRNARKRAIGKLMLLSIIDHGVRHMPLLNFFPDLTVSILKNQFRHILTRQTDLAAELNVDLNSPMEPQENNLVEEILSTGWFRRLTGRMVSYRELRRRLDAISIHQARIFPEGRVLTLTRQEFISHLERVVDRMSLEYRTILRDKSEWQGILKKLYPNFARRSPDRTKLIGPQTIQVVENGDRTGRVMASYSPEQPTAPIGGVLMRERARWGDKISDQTYVRWIAPWQENLKWMGIFGLPVGLLTFILTGDITLALLLGNKFTWIGFFGEHVYEYRQGHQSKLNIFLAGLISVINVFALPFVPTVSLSITLIFGSIIVHFSVNYMAQKTDPDQAAQFIAHWHNGEFDEAIKMMEVDRLGVGESIADLDSGTEWLRRLESDPDFAADVQRRAAALMETDVDAKKDLVLVLRPEDSNDDIINEVVRSFGRENRKLEINKNYEKESFKLKKNFDPANTIVIYSEGIEMRDDGAAMILWDKIADTVRALRSRTNPVLLRLIQSAA